MTNDQVGLTLQRRREIQRLTLEAASRTTRIAMRFLLAMEQDRWEYLPAEVYRVGFLRRYANFLGIDAEDLVQQLRKQRQQSPPASPPQQTAMTQTLGVRLRVLFLGLLVGAAGLLWSLLVHPKGAGGPTPRVNPPPVSPPPATPPAPRSHTHTLEVATKQATWLRVVAHGTLLFEGLLPAQVHRRWSQGERYQVRVGNVKGLELRCDDRPIDLSANAHGDVAEVTVPE